MFYLIDKIQMYQEMEKMSEQKMAVHGFSWSNGIPQNRSDAS